MRYEIHREDSISRVDQPGTLQWGLFVTVSQQGRAGKTHLWIRAIHKYGADQGARKYSWTTGPVPEQVYEEASDEIRSIFDEYLNHYYGLAKELPD